MGQTVIFGCELIDDDEIALSQWYVILRTLSNFERPRKYFIFFRKRVLIIFSDSFPVAESKHLEKDFALTQKQQKYLTISSTLHSICKPVLSCRRTGEGADTHLEDVKTMNPSSFNLGTSYGGYRTTTVVVWEGISLSLTFFQQHQPSVITKEPLTRYLMASI